MALIDYFTGKKSIDIITKGVDRLTVTLMSFLGVKKPLIM